MCADKDLKKIHVYVKRVENYKTVLELVSEVILMMREGRAYLTYDSNAHGHVLCTVTEVQHKNCELVKGDGYYTLIHLTPESKKLFCAIMSNTPMFLDASFVSPQNAEQGIVTVKVSRLKAFFSSLEEWISKESDYLRSELKKIDNDAGEDSSLPFVAEKIALPKIISENLEAGELLWLSHMFFDEVFVPLFVK